MIRYEDLDLVFVSEGAQYDEIELPEINSDSIESMAIAYSPEMYKEAINIAIEVLNRIV